MRRAAVGYAGPGGGASNVRAFEHVRVEMVSWRVACAGVCPAAGLLLVLGIPSLGQAGTEARSLGPMIGFLAAVLVLANLCDHYGLFPAAGSWMAAGSRGRPAA